MEHYTFDFQELRLQI